MFYIVPTPIGNFADITLRALDVLKEVDEIICEDSRVTNKLLRHYNIKKSLYVYNDYSDEHTRNLIISKLQAGKKLALVSDAGTPLISDPGYKLIKAIKNMQLNVTVLPGACSIISALVASGMPTDNFMFVGFLPNTKIARLNRLKNLQDLDTSMVFFESPKRLIATLTAMQEVLRQRTVCVIRELTKKFEEITYNSFAQVISHYQMKEIKGEVIVIVSPLENTLQTNAELEESLSLLLAKMSVKDAVAILGAQSNVSKKTLYNLAVEIKNH
jgi:16S rRNA (cytidine1402-2'-O)-methyltransferase